MDISDKSLIRILTVDVDENLGRINKSALEKAGYFVDTTRSLKEARQALDSQTYALLLTDLSLPDGHGLDILPTARQKDPHAMAIILTGKEASQAILGNAYDVLTKPCPPDTLISTIDRAAEKFWLRRALDARTRELEKANRELDLRVKAATAEIFTLNEKLQRNVEQLLETNEAQTRFLEDMTHELKNPLCVIGGYVSHLLNQGTQSYTQDELNRALQNIRRNSDHLAEMIEEMLDAARLDSHKVMLNKESFLAQEALLEVVESLRLSAEQKGILLLLLDTNADLKVTADRNRLRQILINLVTNAIKFTPKGGRIQISAREAGADSVQFQVEDTGKGINAKDAARIFDRFYQVSDSDLRSKGLGLGLHIVQSLVVLHSGRIWVESEPGKGSIFYFSFPKV